MWEKDYSGRLVASFSFLKRADGIPFTRIIPIQIIEVKAIFFNFLRFLIVACPINSYGI